MVEDINMQEENEKCIPLVFISFAVLEFVIELETMDISIIVD
jgi:hypothetical protein